LSDKHITQLQEKIYMKNRQTGCTQELSAAKAGISARLGRRIEKGETVKQKGRHWRFYEEVEYSLYSRLVKFLVESKSK